MCTKTVRLAINLILIAQCKTYLYTTEVNIICENCEADSAVFSDSTYQNYGIIVHYKTT